MLWCMGACERGVWELVAAAACSRPCNMTATDAPRRRAAAHLDGSPVLALAADGGHVLLIHLDLQILGEKEPIVSPCA